MKRQISFEQYRTIDLTILAVVMAVCQFAIHIASTVLFPNELYIVSPVGAVAALVMMRWGVYAGIHAVLGGVIFTALAGGTWQQFLIYGAGNAVSLLALVMFPMFGKEKIRQDGFLSLAFAFCAQLLMWLGRAGFAAVLGFSMDACLGFITTDILSGLFILFIIWTVRRIDGLFEDQKTYLLRIQSEHQDEGRGQF